MKIKRFSGFLKIRNG